MASDSENSPDTQAAPIFTEREDKILKIAMLCLKGPPPEIDINKFMEKGEFKTLKTAQNTWGTLKKKLRELNPNAESEEAGKNATPKSKAKTPTKKRGKSDEGDDPDGEDSLTSPLKKQKTPSTGRKPNGKVPKTEDEEDATVESKNNGDDETTRPEKKDGKAAKKSPVKKSSAKNSKTTPVTKKDTSDDVNDTSNAMEDTSDRLDEEYQSSSEKDFIDSPP